MFCTIILQSNKNRLIFTNLTTSNPPLSVLIMIIMMTKDTCHNGVSSTGVIHVFIHVIDIFVDILWFPLARRYIDICSVYASQLECSVSKWSVIDTFHANQVFTKITGKIKVLVECIIIVLFLNNILFCRF